MNALRLLAPLFLAWAVPARAEVNAVTLEDCLLTARASHPAISSARDNVENFAAGLTQAKSAYYPQVGVTASAQRSDTYNAGLFGSDKLDALTPYSLTAAQTLYDFGLTGGRVGAARWNLYVARADLVTREDAVALAVKTAYFELLRATRRMQVIEASIKEREDFLATTRRLYERGKRGRFDVLRAETDAGQARLQRVSAAAAVELARRQLLTAMGTPDDPRPLALKDRLEIPPYIVKREKTIVELALGRRPDVAAQRGRAISAAQSVRAARAGHFPQLSLNGGYSMVHNAETVAGGTSMSYVRNWQVGATASLGLFSGLAVKAQVDAAKAQAAGANHDLETLEQEVTLDVRGALIGLRSGRAQIAAASELARNSQEALALALRRFESGSSGFLDVTSARDQLLQAQLSLIDAQTQYREAVAQLEKAVGAPIHEMTVD